MPVNVMLCWPRSGGTLLNRFLTSHPNLVVLSEVNPKGCGGGNCAGVPRQAQEWYGIKVSEGDFAQQILDVQSECERTQKQLVIRDWTWADFKNQYSPSHNSKGFSIIDELEKAGLEVKPFAFVRNAIDVWLSQRLEITEFGRIYADYADALIQYRIPYFHYEDFCNDPINTLQSICSYSEIKFDNRMLDFSEENRVNGDIQLGPASRGFMANEVKVLNRRPATSEEIDAIQSNEDLKRSNSMLGYTSNYFDTKIESNTKRLLRRIIYLLRTTPKDFRP